MTEAELEELKAARGGTVEDGTLSVDKPLYEVLRENKEKKACVYTAKRRIVRADKLPCVARRRSFKTSGES